MANAGVSYAEEADGAPEDYADDSEDYSDEFGDTWHAKLEDALLEGFVDKTMIRNICKCRILPANNRSEVWKICLNVASRGDALSSWDGILDLTEQDLIHQACLRLLTEENQKSKLSDLEAVITFYCKSRAVKYHKDCGWTDLLYPMLELANFERADMYNCFYALTSQYVPRESDAPYHFFHLLLLYHDPELCSFLDSHKVTMDMFTKQWFRSLFASHCKQNVTQAIWDVYLQRGDPMFLFFLGLVILVNAKEQVLSSMLSKQKEEIAAVLADFPSALELVDIEDFCQLAGYFSDKTPQSFLKDHENVLFGGPLLAASATNTYAANELAQSLCVQIGVPDVLSSASPEALNDRDLPQVRFFLVDCRSPEQYNAGHLKTAFHLDATLMLREPNEFATAIDTLLQAQRQAIKAGSAAGGEHLCFIGSGTEEDQYMYMVVSHLLKKHQSYISVLRDGFSAIINYLTDVKLDVTEWITGTSNPTSRSRKAEKPRDEVTGQNVQPPTHASGLESGRVGGFMRTLTTAIKTKSSNIKEKVTKFIENPELDNHVNEYYNSKPYRGTRPVFSIGEEDEHHIPSQKAPKPDPLSEESEVDEEELIDLEKWFDQMNIKDPVACFVIVDKGKRRNAYLAVDGDDLVCLKEYRSYKKFKEISRQPLATISKITSKRSCPELITFRFTSIEDLASADSATAEPPVEKVHRYLIPDAGQATKHIKREIMRVIDAANTTPVSDTAAKD